MLIGAKYHKQYLKTYIIMKFRRSRKLKNMILRPAVFLLIDLGENFEILWDEGTK